MRPSVRRLSLALGMLTMLVGPAFGQGLSASIPAPYRITPNITYLTASNFEAKLDVYARSDVTTPQPTLIWIHGGGWILGNKETSTFSLLPYLEMGWNVVNVEYRLAKVSLAPAAVEDCLCALRWVIRNAMRYGFDTSKLVVSGGSAGAHLALTTAMVPASAGLDRQCPGTEELKVAAVVDWYGITDVNDLLDGPNMKAYAVEWMGSMSNRDEIAKRVSPLTYVRRGLPPIISIQGDADPTVPYQHSVRLQEALKKVSVDGELITIPGGKHGGFTRAENQRAYAAIKAFLARHGLTPSTPQAPQAPQSLAPSAPSGVVNDACPPPLQVPPELAEIRNSPNRDALMAAPPPAVVAFNQEQDRRARNDWGNLCRYRADNAARVAAKAPAPLAVFMGDSITENWARIGADFFAANGYVGRGISGQVTGQNLLRFQQDVIALHPKVVHIMIGTNDVAGNAGPTTYENIQSNIVAMVQMARANKIAVVLATIPPAADFPWRRGMEPAPKIITMNEWIRDYAKREDVVLVDYHRALANAQNGFRAEWSGDGVHPNAEGYKIMNPLAEAAMKAALKNNR